MKAEKEPTDLSASMERSFQREQFHNREDRRFHTPYQEERAILDCVRDGDAVGLERTWRSLPAIRYGPMTNLSDPMHELFYGSIANTTLVTRAAIEGGMDEEAAFSLSDVYIRRMEQAKTLSSLESLNEQMALDFTQRVAAARKGTCRRWPLAIRRCMEAVACACHQRITLEDLALETGLTPKYLSALFRRTTGQTLHHFIESARIDEARHLLGHTPLSLSEIAQTLAFSSQSHFSAIFKKHAGISPKAYRDGQTFPCAVSTSPPATDTANR